MDWLRLHPYAAALGGVAVLLIIGMFIVGRRSAVEPGSSSLRAWSGIGTHLFDTTSNAAGQGLAGEENLYTQVQGGPPFYYAPNTAQIPQTQVGAEDFDFDAFIAMLSHAPQGTSGGETGDLLGEAFSFIPTGLLSTSAPTKARSAVQHALYNYGNEAASSIQSYEDIYRNAPQILKDQFEDKQNPAKNAALLSLANGLKTVGDALLAMENVPSQATSAHEKLAHSYQDMGEKLTQIPGPKTEQTLIEAMLSYNAAAETYTKNYVALVTLFSAYDVTFKPDDPGSVFMFTNVSGF